MDPATVTNQKSETPKNQKPKAEPPVEPKRPALKFPGVGEDLAERELLGGAFPFLAQNGASSWAIGRHWAAGMRAEGVIRRGTLQANGYTRLLIERTNNVLVKSDDFYYAFISPAGCYSELDMKLYAAVTFTDEERASWPK